jgi:maltose O-acetyltransferase
LSRKLHRYSCQASLWISGSIAVLLALGGSRILAVWTHGKIAMDMPTFVLLLAAGVVNSLWASSMIALLATNEHGRVALFYLIVTAVSLPVACLLMAYFKLPGAAATLLGAETVCGAAFAGYAGRSADFVSFLAAPCPASSLNTISTPCEELMRMDDTKTIPYLWRHRKRSPFGSQAWFKNWAKRIYHAWSVLLIWRRTHRLQKAGAQIGALTTIGATLHGPRENLIVGHGCALGEGSYALHGLLTIGNNVAINSGVTILTASHDLGDPAWKMTRRSIQVDDYAWIATGAIILPGVHIGRGAVVGAGAVVGRDVAPCTVVAGNPARPTSRRRTEDLTYTPAAFVAPFEAWLGPDTRAEDW